LKDPRAPRFRRAAQENENILDIVCVGDPERQAWRNGSQEWIARIVIGKGGRAQAGQRMRLYGRKG